MVTKLMIYVSLLIGACNAVTFFNETLTQSEVQHDIKVENHLRFVSTIFTVKCECIGATMSDYLSVALYDTESLQTEVYTSLQCNNQSTTVFSLPKYHVSSYKLRLNGVVNTKYVIGVRVSTTSLTIAENGTGYDEFDVQKDVMVVRTIHLTNDMIKSKDSSHYTYVKISVESDDKTLNSSLTDDDDAKRYVSRLLVTNNTQLLEDFYTNYETALTGSLRLSFSTFGRITISDASHPALSPGTWVIAVKLQPTTQTPDKPKTVRVSVEIVTDYQYSTKIAVLFAVSWIGVVIPLLARVIFDAEHLKFSNLQLKFWLETLKNWFWSGKKGLTYLTALLASLLVVSAFQVVNAKYKEMHETGNRDICYYNEKCFRPYGSIYDVSVNGIASNLPFMVQGVIVIIYFSLSEAHCRSNHHQYFDYSIPYSFGLAFICEGFGSLCYHICPSQIIFQFDTLFMFVISVIMIIGLFEGHSIREQDVRYSIIAKHKAIRTPKVFAFFVGPIYFFNFIGNLLETEGLPKPFVVLFYIIFAFWWVGILGWAAYKLDLLPDSIDPKHVPELYVPPSYQASLHRSRKAKLYKRVKKHMRCIKLVAFAVYCCIVVACFGAAASGRLAFSLFILGVLIIAAIVLTLVFFIPLMWTLIEFFSAFPRTLASDRLNVAVSKSFLFILGTVVYALLACVVSGVSLYFFSYFSVTNKSISPWKSRELNKDCYLNDFYDSHDFWHLFASFALVLMAMVNVQISKPCRDCYLMYLDAKKQHVRKMTMKESILPTTENTHRVDDIIISSAAKESTNNNHDSNNNINGSDNSNKDVFEDPIVDVM